MPISPAGPAPAQTYRTKSESTEAEKENRARLESLQKERQHTETEMQRALDAIRENYQRQSSEEMARDEAALDNERAKGYEKVRELQRQQQREIAQIKKEGEKQLKETENHYREAVSSATTQGQKDLHSIETRQNAEREYATKSHQVSMDDEKRLHEQQIQRFREETDRRTGSQMKSHQEEFERLRETANKASEEQVEKFSEKQVAIRTGFENELNKLNRTASQGLQEIRLSTARRLSAYQERQKDPFYQLVDIGAELYDEGDRYVLRAEIPEHENNHLTVIMKGNSMVVSGNRKNEEKVEMEPGHIKNTASYQSFSETIALPWPVDAKKLAKEVRGNELVAWVPKITQFRPAPRKPGAPQRVIADRPKWPENLKLSEESLQASRDLAKRTEPNESPGREITNRPLSNWKSTV